VRIASLCAVAAALAIGCNRPHPRVICHNGNCGEPTDPEHDDTLPAFRESLALEENGRPVIDGIELDSFYRGADGACLYAHDVSNTAENTPAIAPAVELAAHFAKPGPISFDDGPFLALLELKPYISADTSERHSPEQRVQHALCAWNIYKIISDAAIANGRDVVIEFQSFSPELLHAVLDAAPRVTPTPYVLGAIQGIPSPLDDQTRPLGDYSGLPIADIQVHPSWLLDGRYEAILSSHAELSFFWFSTTTEIFAAIRKYDPTAVDTSEARLMRRWLER
jgi:hypothetical protein